jgi:hypothetical protein
MDLSTEKWLPVLFSDGEKRKLRYAIFWITGFRISRFLGPIFSMANVDRYPAMHHRA